MTELEIIAQIISIFGTIMNFLTYQQKKQKSAIICQLFASLFFAISFLMLGAYIGAILNGIGIVRALIFTFRQKTRAEHIAWLIAFSILFVSSYVLLFTAFGKEPKPQNFIIEILPVIGMISTTISFRCKTSKAVRAFGLISSPLWLIYNIFSFSIGAIISEVLNLISIIVGMIRFDFKRKGKKSEEAES